MNLISVSRGCTSRGYRIMVIKTIKIIRIIAIGRRAGLVGL